MDIYYVIIFFVVGMFFGSFYGVVGSRLPKNESILYPGSHCTKCNHKLKWYELIPVFSYIMQGRKCRKCKTKLSVFYPIVELISGILFAVSYFTFGFSNELYFSLLIVSFFVIVTVSDVSYLIIPDEVTAFFAIVTIILKIIIYGIKEAFFSLLSGTLLFCIMYCIMLLGNKIFKKDTLGGADIKLMFFVGLILSPALGLFNIFVSSCLALPVSLILLYKNKNNVVPYGPFILMGLFLIYCFS